jgi:signal transduction histidine kinase/ligand-binding sensor domain-containing protein
VGFAISPVTGRRARSSVIVLAAIATLHLSGGALALSPDLTIKELHHTAWGPNQGAPLGGAVAVAQTSDGYLWIAGLSALFRFDGIAFERIELPHDPKLSSLRLWSAFAPRGGGLWVGFLFGGVAFLKAGHWQVFSVADGVPQGSPWTFAETPDGTLWVATSSNLARFDGARWKAVGSEMGLPVGDNSMVFVDSQGTIWANGGDRLFFLRPGEQQFRNQPVAAPTPWPARSMAESSTGTVWLDVGHDLVPVAQNPHPREPGRSSHGPVFDQDGTLWDTKDGLRRIAHPEHPTMGAVLHLKDFADAYTEADGLTGPEARTWCADSEGNVWVGTTHGLDRFSEPRFKAPLQSVENLKVFPSITEPGVVSADDAGGLWVTDGDAVVSYKDGRMRPPILRHQVMSLLRVADGTVWFGGRGALWHERQGHLESVAPPVPDRDTQALAEDESGALWASVVRSGVFRLKDGVWTPYGGIAALPRGPAITIMRDRHDRLWFSYPGGSVEALDGERARAYGIADGLQIGNVMANHPGRIGHWFGGEFGLARFEGERFYNVQSAPELPLDGITGIVETSDGDLWLNSSSGIVHLAATELERSRLDPAYRVRGETLGAFDGVVGNGAMLRPLPTAIEAADGMLWYATTGGIYGIDPARRAHNRVPPPVLIRALNVAGHIIEPIPGLTLPAYTTAVSFDYVALSLTAAEKVRYRYRVDSIDTDWRELTAARQALYTNLRPGHYSFRVIAANNDGVWNEQGAALDFSIERAYSQTTWFRAACMAAFLATLWALYRLRLHQIAKGFNARLEERVAERTRIARDLHDTLLQSFQGLLLLFQTVREQLPTHPAEAEKTLEIAIDQAAQAITEGRDTVKGLRASTVERNDLAQAITTLGRELAAEASSHTSVGLQVDVGGTPRTLHSIVRDEIYRIASEALRNAFRHAEAKQIEVELRYDERQLRLRIRDDGRGIDPNFLTAEGRAGHFGLHGMRERAKLIGGKLSVWTAPGSGTEIELSVPAVHAYVASFASWRSWFAERFSGSARRSGNEQPSQSDSDSVD